MICTVFVIGTQTTYAQNTPIELAPSVQEHIITLSENTLTGAHAVFGRFEHIIARIESRSAKLAAEGIDTSAAETRLADARNTLDMVRTDMASMPDVRDIVHTESARTTFVQMSARMLSVRSSLIDARIHLEDALSLLKEAVAQGVSNTDAVIPQE